MEGGEATSTSGVLKSQLAVGDATAWTKQQEEMEISFNGPVLIKCPPERHIAVELQEVSKELKKGSMTLNDQEQYKLVTELIESLYAQRFMTLRRNLKYNFLMFSIGAKDQTLPAKVGKSLPNKTDLDDKEMRLVNDVMQLMAAARFHIMTQEEWTLGLSETYRFNLPVEINWEFFEGNFLLRFWASNEERRELRQLLSPIADKVLVFHRGVGVSEDSGLYLNDKLDLLIEYCLANPLRELWRKLRVYLPFKGPATKSSNVSITDSQPPGTLPAAGREASPHPNGDATMGAAAVNGPAAGAAAAANGATAGAVANGAAAYSRVSSSGAAASSPGSSAPVRPSFAQLNQLSPFYSESGTAPNSFKASRRRRRTTDTDGGLVSGLKHKNARIVERKTMRRIMPTAAQVIANVFQTIKLQEPMFKEVVVVYRASKQGRAIPRSKNPLGPSNPLGTGKDHHTRMRHILNRRNIHIKYFHDIPMADIEAVFPDKKVFSKSISVISMIVQAIMAFVAAIATMWQAGTLTLSTIWSVLSLIGARAGQMYSAMQYERSRVMQDMVNILYDKMNDAQEGVLTMLLEDMAEQQLKEAVLAYTLLMDIKDGLTEEALDERCEGFLEETFDCRIDFAVEDALPQLVEWGLVKVCKATNRYTAVGVSDAHTALTQHWTNAFEATSKPPALKQLPLYNLLPGGEQELLQVCGDDTLFEGDLDEDEHASNEDASQSNMGAGFSAMGKPAGKKKSKGPLHKVNKTIKHLFSEDKPRNKRSLSTQSSSQANVTSLSTQSSSNGRPLSAAAPPHLSAQSVSGTKAPSRTQSQNVAASSAEQV